MGQSHGNSKHLSSFRLQVVRTTFTSPDALITAAVPAHCFCHPLSVHFLYSLLSPHLPFQCGNGKVLVCCSTLSHVESLTVFINFVWEERNTELWIVKKSFGVKSKEQSWKSIILGDWSTCSRCFSNGRRTTTDRAILYYTQLSQASRHGRALSIAGPQALNGIHVISGGRHSTLPDSHVMELTGVSLYPTKQLRLNVMQ